MTWLTRVPSKGSMRISHFVIDGKPACAERLAFGDNFRPDFLSTALPDAHLCATCRQLHPTPCRCGPCVLNTRKAKDVVVPIHVEPVSQRGRPAKPRKPRDPIALTPEQELLLVHMLSFDGWDEVDGVGTVEDILALAKVRLVAPEHIDGAIRAASFTDKGRARAEEVRADRGLRESERAS